MLVNLVFTQNNNRVHIIIMYIDVWYGEYMTYTHTHTHAHTHALIFVMITVHTKSHTDLLKDQ